VCFNFCLDPPHMEPSMLHVRSAVSHLAISLENCLARHRTHVFQHVGQHGSTGPQKLPLQCHSSTPLYAMGIVRKTACWIEGVRRRLRAWLRSPIAGIAACRTRPRSLDLSYESVRSWCSNSHRRSLGDCDGAVFDELHFVPQIRPRTFDRLRGAYWGSRGFRAPMRHTTAAL
jgi:hypothetical protein